MNLGIPDDQQSLDGAVSDTDKLSKVWEKLEVRNVAGTHRMLGGNTQEGTDSGVALSY